MSNDNNNSKNHNAFHRGEVGIQKRAGVSKDLDSIAKMAISDYMPEGHQVFFSMLPMLIVAAEDKNKDIWSSVLIGAPGFITFNNRKSFRINSQFTEFDPLVDSLDEGGQMGLLGIEYETRRRNRVNANITEITVSSLTLEVKQCYGNCPKYIQLRKGYRYQPFGTPESIPFDTFSDEITLFMHQADTLFIASQYVDEEDSGNQGLDSSHRGGMPGFVQVVDEKTLLIPDYIGNNFFNTMGNILLNPKVGIQFLGFENGHRLMLTGTAEIIWAEDVQLPFVGVDRMIRFNLKHGFQLKNCVPYTWNFIDYSPFSKAYKPEI